MDATTMGCRKREREEEEEEVCAAAPAEQPSDEMDAALALSGMLSSSAAARANRNRACELTAFPTTNQFFPCTAGKGWFVKTLEGTDMPFLERLFLILSFPKAALLTRPGLCLSDAIRWKDPEAAELCGAPEGAPCIEIVNVPLFEAEIYPQYASGSFNKTATKWGLISPSAAPDRAGKKLLRECMYMPATEVDGEEVYVLRPLPADTTPDDVNDYIARHLRPLAHAHRAHAAATPSAERSARADGAKSPSGAGASETLDDDQMAQIMSIVKKTTDYQLNETQLKAILALKDGGNTAAAATAAAPAATATATPVTADGLFSAMMQQQQLALASTLAGQIVPSTLAAASPSATASSTAPPPAKKQAVTASWDELRVTLWDTRAKKRVSGSSYKGDLNSYLAKNPHMEVYNRQDEAPKPGQQLLAGQKMHKIETGSRQDPKVVMWHTVELRKLTLAESPTQSELYRFLRANPDVVVYDSQDKNLSPAAVAAAASSGSTALVVAAPPAAASGEKPSKAAREAAKAAAREPISLNFKRLTSLEPAAMSKHSSPGPVGGMFSYSALAQLAAQQQQPAAAPAAAAAQMQQLQALQALLQQQSPSADTLTLLQAAQMARVANVNQLALAAALGGQPAAGEPTKSNFTWK